jgi:hypothetical protein
MPYIGKEPIVGNYVLLDSIVTSATDTYAMLKNGVAYRPESARNMIVSLNGITQAPETAYSVSGSNLIFSQVLSASDVIDYVLVLGDVLDIGVPSDNSVGESQLQYPLTNFSSTGIDDNATSTAITIDSSQNVGIGTASPQYLGHFVNGDVAIVSTDITNSAEKQSLLFGGASGEAGGLAAITGYRGATALFGELLFKTANGGAPTERMRINSTGNVGIGTSNPSSKLEVSGAAPVLELTDTSSTASYGWQPTSNDLRLFDFAASQERLRIDSSGNVGIGTSSPFSALDVEGTITTSVAADVRRGQIRTAGGGMFVGEGGITELVFYSNNAERARIDSSGNVRTPWTNTGTTSIGVDRRVSNLFSTNSHELVINGADGITGAQAMGGGSVRIRGGDGVGQAAGAAGDVIIQAGDIGSSGAASCTGGAIIFETSLTTTATERARIDNAGNLLVGKTSSNILTDGVEINNGVVTSTQAGSFNYWTSYNTGASAYRFYVTAAGTIFATSTSISAISDASLKENVRDLDKGLDTVLALKPRRFDWKNGDGDDIMGFIAQEVEEVLPELVHDYMYNEDETKKSLKMGDMIPSMVKAIQEQQVMIESLKAEVEALKNA